MSIVYVSKPKNVMHHFVDGGILKKIYSTPFYWYKKHVYNSTFFLSFYFQTCFGNERFLPNGWWIQHNDKWHNAGFGTFSNSI